MKKINNIHTRVIKTTKEVEDELMTKNYHTKIEQEKKQQTNNITNIESLKKDIEQQSSNSYYSKTDISPFNRINKRKNSSNMNTSIFQSQITQTQNNVVSTPRYKEKIVKLTAEFDNFKEKFIINNEKLTILEDNYFPYEKDPPNDLNCLIKNYIVLFYFQFGEEIFLFIKRVNKNMQIFYFWTREEDALKYGVDYNQMNIPGIYFDTFENFNSYKEMKEKYMKLDKIIFQKEEKISQLNIEINQLKSENDNLKKKVKINQEKADIYDRNYNSLSDENEELKSEINNYQSMIEELNQENEKLNLKINELTQKFTNNIIKNNITETINSMQNILREESENNINYKPDYTIKSHKAELINNQNQNLINTHRSTLSNYSQTDLENKIRMIAVKLKEEVELAKKKNEIYYHNLLQEKNDIILNFEKELQTIQLENENSKKIIMNLKYLIEIKESENKKLSEFENEINNLRKQVKNLKEKNEEYNNKIKEKENKIEELESKIKGNLIQIKEKENQINEYYNTINYLESILKQNKINYFQE
jgi:hypothetical protein